MSITFTAVVATLIPSFVELVFGDNTRPVGTVNNEPEGALEAMAGMDWADEAVLDVAFYLRLHKFNDFDRR